MENEIGQVDYEYNGKCYIGFYRLTKGKNPLITVSSVYGYKTTSLGRLSVKGLAKMLLLAIIEQYLKTGKGVNF